MYGFTFTSIQEVCRVGYMYCCSYVYLEGDIVDITWLVIVYGNILVSVHESSR